MWNAVFEEGRQHLLEHTELPPVLAGRGLTLEHLHALELGLDAEGNALIPIRSRRGVLIGFKVRHAGVASGRYSELPPGHGNPPWFAPDLLEGRVQPGSVQLRGLLCIEGELNAMVSWLALRGEGWGICGLGSAFGPLDWDWIARAGLPVALFLDPGRVAEKTARVWLERARALGVTMVRLEPLLADWDACEYAASCGLEALGERWKGLLKVLDLPAKPGREHRSETA